MKSPMKPVNVAACLGGAVAMMCIPCCLSLPLAAPLLAWLGTFILGAAAARWYAGMAGVFLLGVGMLLWIRRRSRLTNPPTVASRCNCSGVCQTGTVSVPAREPSCQRLI